MTMQRRVGRRGFASGQRRKMIWARTFITQLNTAGFVTDLLGNLKTAMGINENLPGMTITRIVGTHDLRVVSVDDAFTRWPWGLIVLPTGNAPTVGDAPIFEPYMDWMFVRMESVVQERQEGTPTQNIRAAHYDIDLRSQRKLHEVGSTLWYVGDNVDGDNFDVVMNLNVLVKLP